jgi:hypothetical protein
LDYGVSGKRWYAVVHPALGGSARGGRASLDGAECRLAAIE